VWRRFLFIVIINDGEREEAFFYREGTRRGGKYTNDLLF
jgi:hypothetical protein